MCELREMYMSDLPKVLKIIGEIDDDDEAAAEENFHAGGLEGHYVFVKEGAVIGVTGFREVPATDHTLWLSWTYLSKSLHGQGFGKKMLSELLVKARELNGKRIFVKVSNYVDPEDGPIYASALALYKSMGFEEALTNQDFYDDGEDQIILARSLEIPIAAVDRDEEDTEVLEEKPTIRFNGLREITETEGAYTFSWEVIEKPGFFKKRSFSVEDLKIGIEAVKSDGGRKIFLTFPSNLPLIHVPLKESGFKLVGELQDYYEKGVHDMHFTHDLK